MCNPRTYNRSENNVCEWVIRNFVRYCCQLFCGGRLIARHYSAPKHYAFVCARVCTHPIYALSKNIKISLCAMVIFLFNLFGIGSRPLDLIVLLERVERTASARATLTSNAFVCTSCIGVRAQLRSEPFPLHSHIRWYVYMCVCIHMYLLCIYVCTHTIYNVVPSLLIAKRN